MNLKGFTQFVNEGIESSEIKNVLDLLELGVLSMSDVMSMLSDEQRHRLPHVVVTVEFDEEAYAELLYDNLRAIAEADHNLWIDLDSFAQEYDDDMIEVSFFAWPGSDLFDQEELEEFFEDELYGPILGINVKMINPS
jgi:hypothetical protein